MRQSGEGGAAAFSYTQLVRAAALRRAGASDEEVAERVGIPELVLRGDDASPADLIVETLRAARARDEARKSTPPVPPKGA